MTWPYSAGDEVSMDAGLKDEDEWEINVPRIPPSCLLYCWDTTCLHLTNITFINALVGVFPLYQPFDIKGSFRCILSFLSCFLYFCPSLSSSFDAVGLIKHVYPNFQIRLSFIFSYWWLMSQFLFRALLSFLFFFYFPLISCIFFDPWNLLVSASPSFFTFLLLRFPSCFWIMYSHKYNSPQNTVMEEMSWKILINP